MPKMNELAATLQELAVPGLKAKEIIAAVRERHAGASKKDVVRAAFFALTGGVDGDAEKARRLQALALTERTADEAEATPAARKVTKGKRKAELRQV